MRCEGCSAGSEGWDLYDYCAVCSKNLCGDCMLKRCGERARRDGNTDAKHIPSNHGDGDDDIDP